MLCVFRVTHMKARPEEMVGLFQTGFAIIELEPPSSQSAPPPPPAPRPGELLKVAWPILAGREQRTGPASSEASTVGGEARANPAVESTEGGVHPGPWATRAAHEHHP